MSVRCPWAGRATGGSIRQLHILRGLAGVADVDFLWLSPRPVDLPEPPGFIRNARVVPHRTLPTGPFGHLQWHLAHGLGRRPALPYDSRVRERKSLSRIIGEASGEADLVWFAEPLAAFATWPWPRTMQIPFAVDLSDLVHERMIQMSALLRSADGGFPASVLDRYRAWFLSRNARAWEAGLDALARASTLALVAKEEDAGWRGLDNVVWVPNGADISTLGAPKARHRPPRVVFCGSLGYEPNLDAVRFLVDEIRPRLIAAVGEPVDIRIVGSVPRALEGLEQVPGVTFTGYVDDIADEVGAADVSVVPLRSGTGTRLKVLEAFALMTPVVSTTIGCEGIGAEDSVHLWIADDPDEFARRCARLIGDPEGAREMAQRAHRFVAEKYDWRAIELDVGNLVRSLA